MINALIQKGVIRTHEYKRSDNKIKKKVSKEAEEVLCKKAVSCLSIKSSYSMSDLTADMKTESEDIRQRSAELWNCVRRKPNKLGGYIYTFARPEPKTEAELNTLHDKLDQIYPAVEPDDYLQRRNVHYKVWDLYDPVPQIPFPLPSLDQFAEIIFTSPSTVKAFFAFFGTPPTHLKMICQGPVTQAVLQQYLP